MVTTRKLVLMTLALLALIVFLVIFIRSLQTSPKISVPDREKLVRYYACMLAICTKGCGHDYLSYDPSNPDDIAICVEKDPVTKECKKWCQDICDENGWGNGKYCDQDHSVTVNLEGKVFLRGIYEAVRPWPEYMVVYKSDLDDAIEKLSSEENFPNPSELICEEVKTSGFYKVDYNAVGQLTCLDRYLDSMGPIVRSNELMGYEISGEFGTTQCIITSNTGVGAIILMEREAREIFGCMDKPVGGPLVVTPGDAPGYYSCIFEGSLKIWALSPLHREGWADIVIVSNRYHPDHFILTASPPKHIIPINNWAEYNATIKNNIYSQAETIFSLKIYPPENVTCEWEGTTSSDSTSISITISNASTETLKFKCKANYSGTYEIKIRAIGAIFTESASVELEASDYRLECAVLDCKKELYVNREEDFDAVRIVNKLGYDATFTLELDQRGNEDKLNCRFENGASSIQVWVRDMSSERIALICKPTLDAAGNAYDIRITSKPEEWEDLEKEVILTLNISSCKGPLNITFLDASGKEVTSVRAGNKIKVKLYAEGCHGVQVTLAAITPSYILDNVTLINGMRKYPKEEGEYINIPVGSSTKVYTFYAWADLNKDRNFDERENVSKELVVYPPSPQPDKRIPCEKCGGGNDKWCTYSFGTCCPREACVVWADICDQFGDACSRGNCKDATDPQECNQDYELGCAIYSNLCCISNSDRYSNGPDAQAIPCDSIQNKDECNARGCSWCGCCCWTGGEYCVCVPDKPKEECSGYCMWRGCTGGMTTSTSPVPCLSPDTYTNKDQNEYFQWDGVDDARNVLVRELDGNERVATIHNGGWLMIKISDTSRPVYGITLHVLKEKDGCGPFGSPVISEGNGEILLHDSSGWFKVGEFTILVPISEDKKRKEFFFTPSGEWAWKDIDTIKIVNTDSWVRCNEWGHETYKDSSIKVNYIGLLTKDGTTPFCTEGSGDYHRVVDNGKICYWSLDCPRNGGNGWTHGGKSFATGILGECKCSSGDCGLGYCERTTSWGKRYCYYGVRCMNGGWRFEGIKECRAGETCDYDGGTCSIKIL